MNSMGAVSPVGRDASTLVQGKALGVMRIDARVLLLLITSDAMDTARRHKVSQLETRRQASQEHMEVSHVDSGPSKRGPRPRRVCSRRYP